MSSVRVTALGRRKDIFPLRPATLLSGLAGRRDHLFSNHGLRRLATRHLEITRLEEASVPLHLIACDLLSGQEVRLSEGPTIEAVLAAAAIPGLLPPVRLGDQLLTDGGVANNTPISHAVQLGAERIYVLPADNPQQVPLTSFTHARALIAQALTAARATLAEHDTRPAQARAS